MVATPLLSTKYARPPLPPASVERRRMFETLAEPHAVVLVSAPPGYGKTTLVAGWLSSERRSAAWLTLDESDNDPAVFLAYLVAAVRRALPAIDPAIEAAVASLPPSPASLVPLLNRLGDLGEPIVLALDDYHLVVNPLVHAIVAFLISHLPAGLRVAVVTRHDPPLPLARLRARGQLSEIRAADLRFSPEEAYRFLTRAMRLPISEASSERLTERTEGWIAGLQLAALSLRGRGDPDALVDDFASDERYIFDYLTDETLSRQSPDVRSFLEATCVLDRLTGSLCDRLTGRSDGARMLAGLAKANLFLSPLDDRRSWYRYHPLFANLIASSLPVDRRRHLHRAAAAWFAENDLAFEAIRHHLAADDPEEAAALMEGAADLTLARGEFRTVIAWCDGLPPGKLDHHPLLAVAGAWARFFSGDIGGAEEALSRIGPDDPTVGPRSRSRRTCLEAWFANRHDRPEAVALAQAAIESLPETDPVFRSLAFTTLGEVLVGRDARSAAEAFEAAHRLARVADRSALAAGTVYSLALARLVLGRRGDAEELCRGAIDELSGRVGRSQPWLGMVYLPLGVSMFEADELVQARQHIATGHELCDRAGLRVTMLGAAEWEEIVGLHLAGEASLAWRRLEAVRLEAERHGIRRVVTGMGLLAAELLLLEGDPHGAAARIERVPGSFLDAHGAVRDRGRATSARVLLARHRLADATRILEPLAREQREAGRLGRLITTLVLTAVAHDRRGSRGGADAALREAVELAAGQGYRRVFMDRVLPVAHLLPHARPIAPAFVDDVLRRFGAGEATALPGLPGPAVPAERRTRGELVEPLSIRELEVLRLVAAGLSNQEIGSELFVTTGTAKWHVHNVLAKLGSPNRAALIARARSLGLV